MSGQGKICMNSVMCSRTFLWNKVLWKIEGGAIMTRTCAARYVVSGTNMVSVTDTKGDRPQGLDTQKYTPYTASQERRVRFGGRVNPNPKGLQPCSLWSRHSKLSCCFYPTLHIYTFSFFLKVLHYSVFIPESSTPFCNCPDDSGFYCVNTIFVNM